MLGHKNGKITTHHSGAEIANLKAQANLANEKRASSILLRVVARRWGVTGKSRMHRYCTRDERRKLLIRNGG